MRMRILSIIALSGFLGTSIGDQESGSHGKGISDMFTEFSESAADQSNIVAGATVSNMSVISSSVTAAGDNKSIVSQLFASVMVQHTVTVTRSITVNPPSPTAKPSPDPTVTVTKSITLINSSSSTKLSPTPVPFKACWATGECKKLLIDFAGAYNASGKITDPNQHDPAGHDQSHDFQDQLCRFYQYENLILEKPLQYRPVNFLTCMACFKQAGLDTNTENSPTLDLMYKIDGFCHTNWPNLFDLLENLLKFMLKSEATPSMPGLPVDITGQVPLLRTRFTWTSDMNRKTSPAEAPAITPISTTSTKSPSDATSNSILPWLGSPLTPGAPLPTHLLAQVPANWPYTEYGMLDKAGPVACLPLTTLTDNSTQTVAWLYHSLRWNPRPLYTPPSARSQIGTLYQPLLDSWVRSATWDTSRPTSTQQISQSSGALSEPTLTQSPVLSLDSNSDEA